MSSSDENKVEVNFPEIPMPQIFLPPQGTLSVGTMDGEKVLIYDVKLPGQKNYINAVTYYPDFFVETGWKEKNDGGLEWLLRDLMEISTGNDATVIDFIYKWGPLWASDGDEYHDPEAIWSPLATFSEPVTFWLSPLYYEEIKGEERLLKWKPMEKIERYRSLSRRFSAIVDWMREVDRGHTVSAQEMARMIKFTTKKEEEKYSELPFQRQLVLKILNFYLSKDVGRHFSVKLLDYDETVKTEVKYFTGWGFFGAACLLMAHLISKENLTCMCDSCNKVYERRPPRRMPKKGQYNYCSECSDKKLFWKLYDRDGKRELLKKKRKNKRSE